MHYILNPTDPDAGTSRKNAVSRDNLMNGAGLEYDGYYSGASLNAVNVGATWQSSTVSDDIKESYSFGINAGGTLSPQYSNGKILGRSVR